MTDNRPYKSIEVEGGLDDPHFVGHDFGPDECAGERIPSHRVAKELHRTGMMYMAMAMRYTGQSHLLSRWGVPRVMEAYERLGQVREAQARLDAAESHLDGQNAGSYGKKWAEYGVDKLRAELAARRDAVRGLDHEISNAFDWENRGRCCAVDFGMV